MKTREFFNLELDTDHRVFKRELEASGASCLLKMAYDFSNQMIGDYAYKMGGTRISVSPARGEVYVDSRNKQDRKFAKDLVRKYFPKK